MTLLCYMLCSWGNAAACDSATASLFIRNKADHATAYEVIPLAVDIAASSFSMAMQTYAFIDPPYAEDLEAVIAGRLEAGAGAVPAPPLLLLCTLFVAETGMAELKQTQERLQHELTAAQAQQAEAEGAAAAADLAVQAARDELAAHTAALAGRGDAVSYQLERARLEQQLQALQQQWAGAPADYVRSASDAARGLLLQPQRNTEVVSAAECNRQVGVLERLVALAVQGPPQSLGPAGMLGAVERHDVNRALCTLAGGRTRWFIGTSDAGIEPARQASRADPSRRVTMLNLADPIVTRYEERHRRIVGSLTVAVPPPAICMHCPTLSHLARLHLADARWASGHCSPSDLI